MDSSPTRVQLGPPRTQVDPGGPYRSPRRSPVGWTRLGSTESAADFQKSTGLHVESTWVRRGSRLVWWTFFKSPPRTRVQQTPKVHQTKSPPRTFSPRRTFVMDSASDFLVKSAAKSAADFLRVRRGLRSGLKSAADYCGGLRLGLFGGLRRRLK